LGDDRGPEGGLEPAAVLVGAFEVEVGGPGGVALAVGEHGGVGGAGVDPDVEGVAAAGELGGGGPAGGQGDAGEQLGGGLLIPEVGAVRVRGDLVGHGADHTGVDVGGLVGSVEGDDGHAPRALTADAPIGAGLDGPFDAGLAPSGNPLHAGDGFERGGAHAGLVERDEPLIDGAEDDRGLGAPAVRIAVGVFGLGEQVAGGGEFFQDGEIGRRGFLGGDVLDGFEAGDADEVGGDFAVVEVGAVVADGAVDFEAVFEAGEIILGAVAGRGVHAAGAAL